MLKDCAALVRPTVEMEIKARIQEAPVAHVDETSTKVNGKKHWIHAAVTKRYTYMTIHRKRGAEGTDANGVMSALRGISVHDCWNVYFRYLQCQHAVCGAHLLRELKYLIDSLSDRKWCRQFSDFLLYMKKIKERNIAKGLEAVFRFFYAIDNDVMQKMRKNRKYIKMHHQLRDTTSGLSSDDFIDIISV